MRLQVSTRLGIFAAIELAANSDRQVTVAEIGSKYGVSSHHLAKVMHVLGRAGLVRSVRGAGGGYQFSGNPRRITVLDVVELFEPVGPDRPHAATSGNETNEGAVLGRILGEVDDAARATLGSVTLSTLLHLVERARSS